MMILLALCATGKTEENTTQSPAGEEKLIIARGKLIVSSFIENLDSFVVMSQNNYSEWKIAPLDSNDIGLILKSKQKWMKLVHYTGVFYTTAQIHSEI